MLAVQVLDGHCVEIGEPKGGYTRPREHHRNVRAKAAQPDDTRTLVGDVVQGGWVAGESVRYGELRVR